MDGKIVDTKGIGTDTIVALASGAGPSAIAVVRVSGPGTRAVLEALAGGVPEPRHASSPRHRTAALGSARPRPRAVVSGAR